MPSLPTLNDGPCVHRPDSTVLIADHTADDWVDAIGCLRTRGVNVMLVDDAGEALRRAESEQPQLILLGVALPQLGGFDTCRRLKSNPRTSDIPVIFIAHGRDDAASAEAYEVGGVDWLNKPVHVAELLAKVGMHLSLSTLREQYDELKRTEATLRKSEARWGVLFDNNPIMYFVVDAAGTTLHVNKLGAEQLGYTVEELVGDSVLKIFHEADRESAQRNVAVCLEQFGHAMSWELRKVRKDGSVIWVRETARAVQRDDASPVILVVCEDVTQRKRAEEALREREGRIRRLVESNIIGLFFWDLAGNATEANDAFLQIVGYSRQDLLSGNVRWASITPPEYHAADAHAIEELRQAGTCQPYEKEYIRKDGRRIPVLIGAALLEGSQENGIAFVLDLTERKEAEAERAARRAAEAANQAKNAFLANMSHELRTPLNGILGYAQILQRNKTLGEREIEGLNVIQQSGEHLLTLINDILDFAKMEAGKLELSLTDIALAKFLRIIAEIIDVSAGQKGLNFICDVAPDLPSGIRADESRLRQVLLNLLANAVKFTDHGQVCLRVRVSPPTRLRFEVQDTGIGLRADQLEIIFQPFEQVSDPQRRLGGAGLGLAISRQFVRLMGGDIHVTSQVGVGSTFWFELEVPVIKTEMAAPPDRIATGYEGPRKKVLVVDDVTANRAMAVDMLSQLGFDVIEAVNGLDALEKAQALRPDLILMDIVMPEMGGLEATRRLRQLPAQKDVPIIAVSASTSGGDKESSLAAGMNAFQPKPIDFGILLAQIASLLKLNWTYAAPPASPVPEHQATGPLLTPPAQEMEILHRLAREGNMRDIVQRADHLAELDERYRPFADQLRVLAKGYQSKAILSLVEQHLERSPAP